MKRLPSRPRPFEGECFGGLLGRLASANGFASVPQLGKTVCGYFVHQAYQFPLQQAVELGGLTQDDLKKLWLLPTQASNYTYKGRRMPREFVAPGSRFCALCLDQGSFSKAQWNLAWMPVCVHHHTVLAVRCQRCRNRYESGKVDCDCLQRALKKPVLVDRELVRFIADLDAELVTNCESQWRARMRKLMTGAYLQENPNVWNRQYANKTHMPQLPRNPTQPRQIINYYVQLLDSGHEVVNSSQAA